MTENAELEKVLRENKAALARVARVYAAEPSDQQDLLQEISIRLWRGLDSFKGKSKLSTWVYRVAINTALQFVRKQKPASATLKQEPQEFGGMDDALMLLEEFLAALSPVNRAVLLLDLEGLDRHEIADIMGLSDGAVAVRMTRMKKSFTQQYLEDN